MKCLTSEAHGERREIACRAPCASALPRGECMAITVGVMKSLIKKFIAVLHPFLKIKCKIFYSSKAMCIQILRQSKWPHFSS